MLNRPVSGLARLTSLAVICLPVLVHAEPVTPYSTLERPYYAMALSPGSFTNEVPAGMYAAYGLHFPVAETAPTSGSSTVLARLDWEESDKRIVWTGGFRWWHISPDPQGGAGYVSMVDPSIPVEVSFLAPVDGVRVSFDWEGGPGLATLIGSTGTGGSCHPPSQRSEAQCSPWMRWGWRGLPRSRYRRTHPGACCGA